MIILALDTSEKTASAALLKAGEVLAYSEKTSVLDHSRMLLPMLENMLAEQGIKPDEIDLFAAVTGPGSFTGVRIGTAAVKGFALALDKPCTGISSLEATAIAYGASGEVCAVLHARENEYYYAFFSKNGDEVTRLCDDTFGSAESIISQCKARCITTVLGGKEHFCALDMHENVVHNALFAAKSAYQKAKNGEVGDCFSITPSYLRIPQAERLRIEREREK